MEKKNDKPAAKDQAQASEPPAPEGMVRVRVKAGARLRLGRKDAPLAEPGQWINLPLEDFEMEHIRAHVETREEIDHKPEPAEEAVRHEQAVSMFERMRDSARAHIKDEGKAKEARDSHLARHLLHEHAAPDEKPMAKELLQPQHKQAAQR